MSKVRDIIGNGAIELAQAGAEIGDDYIDIDSLFSPATTTYYKTFDPEHVALMEAVVEAVSRVDALAPYLAGDDIAPAVNDVRAFLSALENYRHEHGLV
jgi:hypothetical protein